METKRKTEAYSERYATWRHLDSIRYQIIQLAIAFIGAVTLIADFENGLLPAWVSLLVGVVYFALWGILAKINSAIRENGEALREFGKTVGDDRLPDVSKKDRSVFHYIEIGFCVLGLTFILAALLMSIGAI
jgi:hypothetical protein